MFSTYIIDATDNTIKPTTSILHNTAGIQQAVVLFGWQMLDVLMKI